MNEIRKNNCYVLTGAPGVGKTKLLLELSKDFNTFNEPARKIISEQKEINGDGIWEKNRDLFLKLILNKSIEDFKRANDSYLTFFDRGITDNIAYANYGNVKLKPFLKESVQYRYNRKVFILSPWEDIYKNDNERKMSYSETLKFHKFILDAYIKVGYQLIEVPNTTVLERAKFIKRYVS